MTQSSLNKQCKQTIQLTVDQPNVVQKRREILSQFRDRFSPFWDGSHDFGTREGLLEILSTFRDSPKKRGRKRINYLGQFVDIPGQSLNILGLTVQPFYKKKLQTTTGWEGTKKGGHPSRRSQQ